MMLTVGTGDLYVSQTCRKFGDRVFAVAAPRVWNSLPTSNSTGRQQHLSNAVLNYFI